MCWTGKVLKNHLVSTSHQTKLLKAPSDLALNTSTEGATATSLPNLFQCLTTRWVKNVLLISILSLFSSGLKPSLCPIFTLPNKAFPIWLLLSTGRQQRCPRAFSSQSRITLWLSFWAERSHCSFAHSTS